MDISVEVAEALTEALSLAGESRRLEVEPRHVLFGIAKRRSWENSMNMLIAGSDEESTPRIPVATPSSAQLLPSNELCAAMASAQRHAHRGYLCTRDILNGFSSTSDRRIAESAKRLLRDLPLTPDLRATDLDPRLRTFLYEIDRSCERQADREILRWLGQRGSSTGGEFVDLRLLLGSAFTRLTTTAEGLATTAKRLAAGGFIILSSQNDKEISARLSPTGERCLRENDGYTHRISVKDDDKIAADAKLSDQKTEATHIAVSTRRSEAERRKVFLVHGRDLVACDALIVLLKAFDLRVIHWRDAAAHAGGGTPYTGDIVAAGMELADAVVVLLTPDDIGHVHPAFRIETDGPNELEPTGQPRLNVIFEAGMAMARDRHRVVLVEFGQVRKLSDTDGLNVVRLMDSIDSRKDLAQRLRSAGLSVDTEGEEWRTAGNFSSVRRELPADSSRDITKQLHSGLPDLPAGGR